MEVRIHDYSDGNVAVLGRMLEKRLRAYKAAGYTVEPPAPASTARETTIEYEASGTSRPDAVGLACLAGLAVPQGVQLPIPGKVSRHPE